MFHIQVFRYVENLSGISCVKFNRCLNCNVLIPLHCSRSNYCYCPYFSDLCAFLYCAEVDWAMCLCRGSISADAEICDKRIHLVNFNSDLYARIHLKLCIAVPKDPFLQERFFLEICMCTLHLSFSDRCLETLLQKLPSKVIHCGTHWPPPCRY